MKVFRNAFGIAAVTFGILTNTTVLAAPGDASPEGDESLLSCLAPSPVDSSNGTAVVAPCASVQDESAPKKLTGYVARSAPAPQQTGHLKYYTECTYSFLPKEPGSKYTYEEFEETWENRFYWQESLHARWSRYDGAPGVAVVTFVFDPDKGVDAKIAESSLSPEFANLAQNPVDIDFLPRVARGMVISAKFCAYESGVVPSKPGFGSSQSAPSRRSGKSNRAPEPVFVPHMTCISGQHPAVVISGAKHNRAPTSYN